MSSVTDHYAQLLADHYNWIYGGTDLKCSENAVFFEENQVNPCSTCLAVDLGAGCGFQSIPLAQRGYEVMAIDLCDKLLADLERAKGVLPIHLHRMNLVDFDQICEEKPELIVCMGDTLPHLDRLEDVWNLMQKIHDHLADRGQMILSWRDLSYELKELERFIPVKSDSDRVFTCFLEYEEDSVKVHDLLYQRSPDGWEFRKSFYRKLKIRRDLLLEKIQEIGFEVCLNVHQRGFVTVIAQKTA